MRFRKKDDWDDDWDDDDVKKPGKLEKGPGVLNTRRILLGLVVIAFAAILIGSIFTQGQYEFSEVPAGLLGTWTCNDPEKSDLWVEFRPKFIVFGTGGTGMVSHRIVGVNLEQVGGRGRYKVYYRDLAGREHEKEAMLAESGLTLRFADDPRAEWDRYE